MNGKEDFESVARTPLVPEGTFRLDTAQSTIRWTGRNLFNHHSGTVRLAAGEIILRQGRLISARLSVDMNSIACEDLADSALKAMLIAHLRTADFFDVEHHPMAEFAATAAEEITGGTDGVPNYIMCGTFTLRGITRPLEFPVLFATFRGRSHGRTNATRTGIGACALQSKLPGELKREPPAAEGALASEAMSGGGRPGHSPR